MKSGWKRALLSLLLIILAFPVYLLGTEAYLHYARERSQIKDILPVDLNANGRDELIVFYQTGYANPNNFLNVLSHSVLEARDLAGDRVLWRKRLDPDHTGGGFGQQSLARVGNRLFVLLSNSGEFRNPSSFLYTLDMKTGETLSRYQFETSLKPNSPLSYLFSRDQTLYALLHHTKENSSDTPGGRGLLKLHRFDAQNGRYISSLELGADFYSPVAGFLHHRGDYLILYDGVGKIYPVNVKGFRLGRVRRAYKLAIRKGTEVYYGDLEKRLYRLQAQGEQDKEVKRDGQAFRLGPFPQLGPAGNEFRWIRDDLSQARYGFPGSFQVENMPLYRSHEDRNFHLFLARKYKPVKGGSTSLREWRFRILEAKTGNLHWESKSIFDADSFVMTESGGFVFFTLNKPIGKNTKGERKTDAYRQYLLVFEEKTGSFRAVFPVGEYNPKQGISERPNFLLREQPIRKGLYYLVQNNKVFVLDLKTMQSAYPASDFLLEFRQSSKELEDMLGPLP